MRRLQADRNRGFSGSVLSQRPTSHGERGRYELNEFGRRDLEIHERWEMGAWVEHARPHFVYATRCHLDQIITVPTPCVVPNPVS